MALRYTTASTLAAKFKSEKILEKSRYRIIFSLHNHIRTGSRAESKAHDSNHEKLSYKRKVFCSPGYHYHFASGYLPLVFKALGKLKQPKKYAVKLNVICIFTKLELHKSQHFTYNQAQWCKIDSGISEGWSGFALHPYRGRQGHHSIFWLTAYS